MRIILAMDGSPESEAAALLIAAQHWPRDSTVRLLTVMHSIYLAEDFRDRESATFWRLLPEVDEAALRLNVRSATMLRESGLAVEITIQQGDPGPEIVADAHSWHADLVMLGSHGRTGSSHRVLGSVAEYVVLHAKCTVEVVPAVSAEDTGCTDEADVERLSSLRGPAQTFWDGGARRPFHGRSHRLH